MGGRAPLGRGPPAPLGAPGLGPEPSRDPAAGEEHPTPRPPRPERRDDRGLRAQPCGEYPPGAAGRAPTQGDPAAGDALRTRARPGSRPGARGAALGRAGRRTGSVSVETENNVQRVVNSLECAVAVTVGIAAAVTPSEPTLLNVSPPLCSPPSPTPLLASQPRALCLLSCQGYDGPRAT